MLVAAEKQGSPKPGHCSASMGLRSPSRGCSNRIWCSTTAGTHFLKATCSCACARRERSSPALSKVPEMPSRHKRREEREFRVDDFESCLAVFEALGFPVVVPLRKIPDGIRAGQGTRTHHARRNSYRCFHGTRRPGAMDRSHRESLGLPAHGLHHRELPQPL